MAKYTALDIANWFLRYNEIMMIEAGADYLSLEKLQLLMYYAQGFYMATCSDLDLYPDAICSGPLGVYIESVFRKYENCRLEEMKCDDNFGLCDIDKAVNTILELVYDRFAQYSCWKLYSMIQHETPWLNTIDGQEIDKREIERYFSENHIEDLHGCETPTDDHKESSLGVVSRWEWRGRTYILYEVPDQR